MSEDAARVKITARRRDWNCKCNGTEEHRRVVLPGETEQQWATDAGPVTGRWERRGMYASQRQCVQYVLVPQGTIVIDFERRFRAGVPAGRAAVTVGIVEGDDVRWGLPYKRVQGDVRLDLARIRGDAS